MPSSSENGRGWGGVRRKVSTGCVADSSKLGSVLPFSDLWSIFYTRFENLLLDTKPGQIGFCCMNDISFLFVLEDAMR